MRDGVKLAAGLVLSVTLAAGAQARINPAREGGASGPYRAITDRNIFGLLHIDTNVVAEPPLPPPNVNLIGLMQVSGNPQVVLAISEPGPGAKAPVSYIMGVDERQQGVDVLSIDLAGKTAKVQVGENISVLKLVEPKPVTTGVVVGALPSGPGPGQGMMGGRPPGFPPNRPGFVTTPSGFNSTPAYNNTSVPGAFNPNANLNPATGGDSGSLPNRPVRTDADAPQMSAEQQMYNMEIQRAAALEAGSPIANLLPITPITPPQAIQQMNGLMPNSDSTTQQQQQQPTTSLTPTSAGPAWGGPKVTGTGGPTLRLPGGQ